jgi:hypothetical protein
MWTVNISERSQKRVPEGKNSRLDHTITYKIVLQLSYSYQSFLLSFLFPAGVEQMVTCSDVTASDVNRLNMSICIQMLCPFSYDLGHLFIYFLNLFIRSVPNFPLNKHLVITSQKGQPTAT